MSKIFQACATIVAALLGTRIGQAALRGRDMHSSQLVRTLRRDVADMSFGTVPVSGEPPSPELTLNLIETTFDLSPFIQQDAQECLFVLLGSIQAADPSDPLVRALALDMYVEAVCECGRTSRNLDHCLDMAVRPTGTTQDALEAAQAAEEFERLCESCGSTCSTRQQTVVEAPHLLAVRFQITKTNDKRDGGEKIEKRNTEVDAQVVLRGALFRLKSVVAHRGSSISSGHYVAVALDEARPSSVILYDDDQTARFTSVKAALEAAESHAYIAFYERVDSSPVSPSTEHALRSPPAGSPVNLDSTSTAASPFLALTASPERLPGRVVPDNEVGNSASTRQAQDPPSPPACDTAEAPAGAPYPVQPEPAIPSSTRGSIPRVEPPPPSNAPQPAKIRVKRPIPTVKISSAVATKVSKKGVEGAAAHEMSKPVKEQKKRDRGRDTPPTVKPTDVAPGTKDSSGAKKTSSPTTKKVGGAKPGIKSSASSFPSAAEEQAPKAQPVKSRSPLPDQLSLRTASSGGGAMSDRAAEVSPTSKPVIVFTRVTSARHTLPTAVCVELANEAKQRAMDAGCAQAEEDLIASIRFGLGMDPPSRWAWHASVPLDSQPLRAAKLLAEGACGGIVLQGLTAVTTNIEALSSILADVPPDAPFTVLFSTSDRVTHPVGDIVAALRQLQDSLATDLQQERPEFDTSAAAITQLALYVSTLQRLSSTTRQVDSPQDLAIRLALEDLSRKIKGGLTVALNLAAEEDERPSDASRREQFGPKLVEIIAQVKSTASGESGKHRPLEERSSGMLVGADIDSAYPNSIRSSLPRPSPTFLPQISREFICYGVEKDGSTCGKTFATAQNYDRHQGVHTITPENTPWYCTSCSTPFRSADTYRVHNKQGRCFRARQLAERPVEAQAAAAVPEGSTEARPGRRPLSELQNIEMPPAKQPSEPKKVAKVPPPNAEGRYPCDKCSKTYSSPTTFANHSPCYKKDRKYPCEFAGCTRTFQHTSSRGTHYRLDHSKNKAVRDAEKERLMKADRESKKRKREREDEEDMRVHGRKRDRKIYGDGMPKRCSREVCGASQSSQWLRGPEGELLCDSCARLLREGKIPNYKPPADAPKFFARSDKGKTKKRSSA